MNTIIKNKVAEITILFWIIKIVATTLGETLGDYISMTLELGYFVGIMITALLFITALLIQLNVKKFIPFFLLDGYCKHHNFRNRNFRLY